MEISTRQDFRSELTNVALDAVYNLEGVDTISEAAKYVPVQYFGVMAGKDAPDYQDGTFIVKKSNIVAIKRYVSTSLALPVDLSRVERELGYKKANIAGLEPADIQELYQNTHKHALSWRTLERETKNLGTQLDNFSQRFYSTGVAVIDHLKNTRGYKSLGGTIETMTAEELAGLAAIPLDHSDTETVRDLAWYFDRMKNDIESFYHKIKAVKALAVEFSRKISDELLPAISVKLDYIEKSGMELDAREEALRIELRELDERIAEKLDEYRSLVGYAFAGLVFGPLGVAITGGIFGSKAEQVRSDKNALLEDRSALLEDMQGAKVTKLMNDLGGRLVNLQALMVDAERGAKNLEDVWAIIYEWIRESANRASEIDNALKLNRLVLELESVVNPWNMIKGHAYALSKVFNEVAD